MPELPEVHTTVQGMQTLINNEITNIKIYSTKLRYYVPKNITKLIKNAKFLKIYRIGKYILADFNNNYSLIFHLGMSGRFIIINRLSYHKKKHDHFVLNTNNFTLIFNDIRKFGFIDLSKTKDIYEKKYISHLGIDALDKRLNKQYILNKIQKSIVPIKQILIDQRVIAGIGNIYASEILYNAKISPLAKGHSLNILEIEQLIKSIRKILIKAIIFGGSSLKDYVSTDGTIGNFQKNFKVYNKEGQKVSGYEIKRIIQYGRSTYYCPKVQLVKKF